MEPNYGYVQATEQKTSMFSKKIILLAGGLLVAIIIAIILLTSSANSGIGNQGQHLLVRYSNLQAILSDTKTTRNLKNQDLSNIVTSFNLTTTTDINDLTTALEGQIPVKIHDSIIAAEADTTTAKAIEDAYLENKLDVVYTDTLIKKIDSLRALIAETYGKSKDQKLKSTLIQVDDNLLKARKQLEELKL
jgi:hypothetical protein